MLKQSTSMAGAKSTASSDRTRNQQVVGTPCPFGKVLALAGATTNASAQRQVRRDYSIVPLATHEAGGRDFWRGSESVSGV